MSTKKVNFKKEVSKVSIGGTPRLSVLNNNDENEAPPFTTPKSKSVSTSRLLPSNKNKAENDNLITVGIRIRPLSKKEITQGHKNVIQVSDNYKKISINDPSCKQQQFECDICFTDNNSSQSNVFDCIGTPLLSRSFEGFNVSIFAYGQTGSGKTYSMIGSPQDQGIIPRFINSLFSKISTQKDAKMQVQCEISYYEIYNEKVYDLLNRSSNETGQQQQLINKLPNLNNDQIRTNLKVREDPDTGPYIENLLKISCENANDVLEWFEIGNKRRATACTNTNDKSSRSHSIFQINLKQIKNESEGIGVANKSKLQILTSKINLIDLAGSERINNLQNHHQQQSSSRFKESTCINKSLLTLGKIICILSENQQNGIIHLPYRESELTWLLKESLGGNSKTAMLATINPSSQFLDETLSTLRYAAKTACIKNSAMLNRGDLIKYDLSELDVLKEERLKSIKQEMEQEWILRLNEANRLKEAELANLEKSLIIRNEEEKCSKNCCLINLNEDPLLSEKLIYLIKSSNRNGSTIIGSNKLTADIVIQGPLIASNHAKIQKNNDELTIEQIDKSYHTFINGDELVSDERRQLNHGDRIVFGGSHYFRLNNPKSIKTLTTVTSSSGLKYFEFKDYLFAKNEMEEKQNILAEEKFKDHVNRHKEETDRKVKETEENIKRRYEEAIEKMKHEFENKEIESKKQIENIKCESAKKIKKVVYQKVKLETKLNILESSNSTNSNDVSRLSTISSSTTDSCNFNLQTPTNISKQDKLITQFKSELKKISNEREINNSIYEQHTNINRKFSLTLKLNEMNKICNLLKFNYEFKLHEIYDSNKRSFLQIICCVNKLNNLAIFLNFDYSDEKLLQLRSFYSQFIEENDVPNEESLFLGEQDINWQDLDELLNSDLSPKLLDSSMSKTKSSKRRFSISNTEDQVDSVLWKNIAEPINTFHQNNFKKFKASGNLNIAFADFIDNLRSSDSDEEIKINQKNILDDHLYLLCNQFVYYLNENNEESTFNISTIATNFYHLRKMFRQQEFKIVELIREYSEITDKLMINLSGFIRGNNESLSLVKSDINGILRVNGRLKFHYFINFYDFNLIAAFDYQNKYLSLNLIKYFLAGFYIEYNQFIKNFIDMLDYNSYSFKYSILEFMNIFTLFKVDEYEQLVSNTECNEDDVDSVLIHNFINYTIYMLKTCKKLNEIMKIFNESDFKKNKNSTYSTLIQSFESILTDTIQIQIMNQSFNSNKTKTFLFDEEPELINESMDLTIQFEKSNEDRLFDAFKDVKNSLKTFFQNIIN